ncbi:fasciclin-like arabinogalactan protein 21 [Tanacetum coccineum]
MDSMTVFAVDDAGVFGDGHLFVANLKFHIVPNMRLTALELLNLPVDTVLPTMVSGENVVVTVDGGGGPLTPMRINNVKVTSMNVVINDGIVVHGIAAPLPRVHRTSMGFWPDDDLTDEIDLGPTATSDYDSREIFQNIVAAAELWGAKTELPGPEKELFIEKLKDAIPF